MRLYLKKAGQGAQDTQVPGDTTQETSREIQNS